MPAGNNFQFDIAGGFDATSQESVANNKEITFQNMRQRCQIFGSRNIVSSIMRWFETVK